MHQRRRGALLRTIPLAVINTAGLLTITTAAKAAEFDYAGGKFTVNGAMSLGAAIRTDSRDPALLFSPNATAISASGSEAGGRNQDDGNLNFGRGDAFNKVLKGWLKVGYTRANHGAELSAKGWYDFALSDDKVPWGNFPNGYKSNETLSDKGARQRSKFAGIVINDANVFGRDDIADGVFWRLGWQKIDWGNQYYAFGGLRDLMPVDFSAELRPGVQRDEETRISIPALFARADLTKATAIEGFAQLAFTPNSPYQCGTFYSQLDFVSEGCNVITLGQQTDPTAVNKGNIVKRALTPETSDSGQFGVALKHKVDSINTEFGLYATQFHSRASYYGAIKSERTSGAPFVPGDPGGLNPKYFTEYPEDIRMFALSSDTKFRNGSMFSEISYRPNQPFQYNAVDLLTGFTTNAGPTPLRSQINALAPGERFHGYERYKSLQLQLGGNLKIPEVLGASALQLGAQLVYRRVPDLPDVNTVRFRRSDVFGQGPVAGKCTGTSVQCSNDGYVSQNAFGYRLQASLRYPNVIQGVDFVPSVFYGQDVSGWSEDGTINEGRQFAVVSLKAIVDKRYTAELAWLPTWGGTYNNLRDRSAAQATIGLQF